MLRKWALAGGLTISLALLGSQALGAEAKYVGDNATKCAMCHKAQVDAWKKWPMANSWAKLQASPDKKDSCIPCHVTGFGKPGGFKNIKETPKLVNVQCEACHGPASEHLKVPLKDKEGHRKTVSKPTEASCKTCHKKEGNPNFKSFDYKEAVKQLANHKNKK